jgi:ubiquinone/menaquinone biosynthesis C-methylase UbiE
MIDLETWLPVLRSPGGGQHLRRADGDVVDESGRQYPIIDGLLRLLPDGGPTPEDARWAAFYDRMAPVYDRTERWGARLMFGLDLRAEQRAMVAALRLAPGSRVLEVSPGPGIFQPWLAAAVGKDGALAALDLSWGMVRRCAARTRRQVPTPLVCQGDGTALPFADGAFDALFHFGGIKLFSRPDAALREFARVVRVGGQVFVGDEGYSPDLPDDWRRRMLVRMNPGFLQPPPSLPPQLSLVRESWVYAGYAFLWSLTRTDAAT